MSDDWTDYPTGLYILSGDELVVYMKCTVVGKITISDGGETLAYLYSEGVNEKQIAKACSRYGLSLASDGNEIVQKYFDKPMSQALNDFIHKITRIVCSLVPSEETGLKLEDL